VAARPAAARRRLLRITAGGTSLSGPTASRRATRAGKGLTEVSGCRGGVEEGLKAEVLVGASSSGRRRSWTVPTALGIRGGENAAEKRAKNRGRQSSLKGINDGGGLAKSDEVECFPMPSTDEEDAGKEVLAGGQLTTDYWLVRGRIGKRRRWSHTAQQHSMVGENGVVGVV
jgi:hypothetical protein